MIDVTEFDERIRIESPNYSGDDCGGADVLWQEVETCFAKVAVRAVSASVNVAGQREYQPQYHITIRAPRELSDAMRIVWREKILAIDSIRPSSAYLHIQGREVRA